jgi:hypothetical protein
MGNDIQTEDLTTEPEVYTNDDLRDAETAVDQARADYNQAGRNVQAARIEHAKCLTAWNAGIARPTPAELNQAFREQSLAERAARARPYIPTVTETARAMAGPINTRRGGGSAYRRGPAGSVRAYSKAQAQQLNQQLALAKAAAAAKLS